MTENLEKLIDLAITDGVLTDKEKQILIRKAEEAGVEWDEVEMILEAKLHQRQQAKAKFEDSVKKCPSCKEPIPALSKVCPACGHVVNAESSTSDSKSLETLIESIENSIIEIKSFPKPSVISTLKKQLPIILIAIGAILFVTATKIGTTDLGYMLMIGGGVCAIGAIVTFINKSNDKDIKEERDQKLKEKGIVITEKKESSFETLKADFEKHSRTAKTFFGENKKVSILIDEFKAEIQEIEQKRKKLMSQNWIVYGILGLITVSILFIPKGESNYLSTQEEEQKEIQEKLADLKTTEYIIDGAKVKTTGNFGSFYQITSTKATVNIDYNTGVYVEGYVLSIQGIKLTLNTNDKQKLKKEIAKIKKDCSDADENSCGEIKATLMLEDENNNSVGIAGLELPYGSDSDKKAPFYSESEEVLLSFEGQSYTKKDLDKLSKVKNYTISIIITKN
jgi:hypothetical protein